MVEIGAKCDLYVGPNHVGDEILCVRNVSYKYPDGTNALSDISFHVRRNSTLAVVGPNGAGKTTLLKILIGLVDGYDGSVEVAGMTPRQARLRGGVISWVPQRAKMMWDFPVTVHQVVKMGLVGKTRMFGRYAKEDLDYVRHIMDILDISKFADKPIGEVSGGQQQRAIIARALAPRPLVLMLDEPTVGVDQAGLEVFTNLMRQIRETFGLTLVLVTHDLRAVLPECERIACLNRTLHFHDSPAKLTPQLLSEVFRCDLTGLFATNTVAAAPQEQHNHHHDHDHDHEHGHNHE